MGLVTGPDALLRLVRAQPEEQAPISRILGGDDFSFWKRKCCGTIFIDLEQRMPIDILPGREADTLEKWLKAHEGVEIMSRDRGGAYAEGARKGAPQAQQVADRWHLFANLSDTMQGFFLQRQDLLKSLVQKTPTDASLEISALESVPWHTGSTERMEAKSQQFHQERVERSHHIQDLATKKIDVATIALQLGLSRQTVSTSLQMKQPPARTRIGRKRDVLIGPSKDYLICRWNEGCRSAQHMHREIAEQG